MKENATSAANEDKPTPRVQKLDLFLSDALKWEDSEMTKEDEDSFVLALWHWARGYNIEEITKRLPRHLKLLFTEVISKKEAQEKNRLKKAEAGRLGGKARMKVISQPKD